MFQVVNKETGEVFTVYDVNGTHFLLWDKAGKYWYYSEMGLFAPLEN